MPLIGKNIHRINSSYVVLDPAGKVTGLEVIAEVNYGTSGMDGQLNIWDKLSPEEKAQVQAIVDKAKALLEAKFLG